MPNGEAVVGVGKAELGRKVGKAVREWKVERGEFRVFEEEVGPIGRNLGDTSSRKSHYLRHALAFSIWTDPKSEPASITQFLYYFLQGNLLLKFMKRSPFQRWFPGKVLLYPK